MTVVVDVPAPQTENHDPSGDSVQTSTPKPLPLRKRLPKARELARRGVLLYNSKNASLEALNQLYDQIEELVSPRDSDPEAQRFWKSIGPRPTALPA